MNHTHIIKFNCLTGFLNYFNNNVRRLTDAEYDDAVNQIVKFNSYTLNDGVIISRNDNGSLTALSVFKIDYQEGS